MISNQTLLNEMEKHITNAKNLKNDEALREHIIAVRALCDLALATKGAMQTLAVSQSIQPSAFVERTPSSLTSTKLEEDDANGDSIFDF